MSSTKKKKKRFLKMVKLVAKAKIVRISMLVKSSTGCKALVPGQACGRERGREGLGPGDLSRSPGQNLERPSDKGEDTDFSVSSSDAHPCFSNAYTPS